LDRHLSAAGEIRLLGGAALILGYGAQRTTEDADLLLDDAECQALIDSAGFSEAVEATNRDLEPQGLYLTHIWGPEQIPLTPAWRAQVRAIDLGLPRLRVTVLGPLDLITSKLARGDDADLADVAWLVRQQQLSAEAVDGALSTALVPEVLAETYAQGCARVRAMMRNA
jgi:hypothetical protein